MGAAGARQRGSLVRSLVHFVLPAAMLAPVVGLGVYLAWLLSTYHGLLAAGPGLNPEAAAAGALLVAQTALTTVCVFCGLLLVVFSKPPTPAWTGGDELSGDWRPTALAALLLAALLLGPSCCS